MRLSTIDLTRNGSPHNSSHGPSKLSLFTTSRKDLSKMETTNQVDDDDAPIPQKYLKAKAQATKTWQTMGYLAIWYFFSTSSTFTNRVLMKENHMPAEALTLCQQLVCVICDFIVLNMPSSSSSSTKAWKLQPLAFRHVMWLLPLSMISITTKVMTYWSYDVVPVAIAHTCKASQPFFNVLLTFLVYRTKFSMATYLSLVPIVVGVMMASISEMGMNNLGFLGVVFAVVSAMLGVMQSMYAKYLLRSRIVVDSINLHFYSALVALTLNLPMVLYNVFTTTSFPSEIPYYTMLGTGLMHFVGTFCSSLVLGDVTELTFSIMSTMKRVVIILSAVFYFGTQVTFQSVTGMILAMIGVGTYQYIKVKSAQAPMPLPLPR